MIGSRPLSLKSTIFSTTLIDISSSSRYSSISTASAHLIYLLKLELLSHLKMENSIYYLISETSVPEITNEFYSVDEFDSYDINYLSFPNGVS